VQEYSCDAAIVIVILFTFHKSNVGYNPVDIDIVPYYTNTCNGSRTSLRERRQCNQKQGQDRKLGTGKDNSSG
jgi:hypothetical protein